MAQLIYNFDSGTDEAALNAVGFSTIIQSNCALDPSSSFLHPKGTTGDLLSIYVAQHTQVTPIRVNYIEWKGATNFGGGGTSTTTQMTTVNTAYLTTGPGLGGTAISGGYVRYFHDNIVTYTGFINADGDYHEVALTDPYDEIANVFRLSRAGTTWKLQNKRVATWVDWITGITLATTDFGYMSWESFFNPISDTFGNHMESNLEYMIVDYDLVNIYYIPNITSSSVGSVTKFSQPGSVIKQ